MKQIIVAGIALLGLAAAHAQQDFGDVVVDATLIRDGLYLISGRGGNIVASSGADGTFLVDDQYAPLSERIRRTLDELDAGPVRFVINTHWHGDHVGGNEAFGEAGAVIVAHENVRSRMSSEQFNERFSRTIPPSPAKALPVVTFAEGVKLHLNGDTVHVLHVDAAHTDGDALVWFEQANVLHMGDLYFNGLYPFIDLDSGGGIHGMIAGVKKGLSLADAETAVVPGHGPLSDRAGLEAFGAMLGDFRDRIAALKGEGKTLEEVVAARPTAEFDEALGGGFIPPQLLVEFIFNSL
jgi:cyclase